MNLRLPIIVVNFKSYENATGKKALELAKIHQKVADATGVQILIAVQPVDVRMLSSEVNVPVLSQHFDPVEYGAYTGHLSPHTLMEAGAMGSLLNHAEKQVHLDTLKASIEMAKKIGFFTIVCANTAEIGKTISEFGPDLVAVELPELIGGNVSITSANPQIVSDAVRMIGAGKVLVGAGVKTKEDVLKSLELGASGVVLASGITKAEDPEKVLMSLAEGILEFKKSMKNV